MHSFSLGVNPEESAHTIFVVHIQPSLDLALTGNGGTESSKCPQVRQATLVSQEANPRGDRGPFPIPERQEPQETKHFSGQNLTVCSAVEASIVPYQEMMIEFEIYYYYVSNGSDCQEISDSTVRSRQVGFINGYSDAFLRKGSMASQRHSASHGHSLITHTVIPAKLTPSFPQKAGIQSKRRSRHKDL